MVSFSTLMVLPYCLFDFQKSIIFMFHLNFKTGRRVIWGISLISSLTKTVEQTLREKPKKIMEWNNEHQYNETNLIAFSYKITKQ